MTLEKILIVGRQSTTQQIARLFAKTLYAADEVDDLWELLESVEPNLLVFDAGIARADILQTLQTLHQKGLCQPVLIFGPLNDPDLESFLSEYKWAQCVENAENTDQVGRAVSRLLQTEEEPFADSRFFMEDCPSSVSIVGKSKAMMQTLRMVRLVAQSNCNPVLIVGETGTGKELAARAVHILRNGARQKFVAINCAALTANLLESELFGHTKGSFTSADREKTGLLELADGGTVFLDEISEMPLDLQAKLLRVLQERRFRKVGGLEEIECKATLIASSNRNLLQEVENGRFRRDLYYRLCVCPIPLAPLRAESRKEDILLLAEYFIQTSTICPEKKGKIKGLTSMAAEMLTHYHWPGNVRELKNVIERAILLEAGDRIGTTNLLLNPALAFEMDQSEDNANSLRIKDFSLEKAEKELVKKALDEAGWQKSRAASLLGITRATLYAKVKQYNLQEPEKKPQPVL
ncbi:MAG TPA: sigma-54 dependent transcriptional regulator [Anaerohalosphaeraceae bacterium]|jgi:two-component system response regulator AtoC|nr:sigma-54 dependent transcriptional regulator [Anaerohalosphaeraceae bacterium]HPB94028.1 sigma-54 dependent transcriptional regulator [Anaerohalosphaeraceae bacterium]HRT22458.1 sigma-54 dependent transcriptional regulator [Anaerohalosphaeraceae bacterium]HRU14374.1 sigma-54 dependent transcriptional regulator [Anaerohalosphaeraceae bacterium]